MAQKILPGTRRAGGSKKAPRRKPAPDTTAILGALNDGHAIAATAHWALVRMEEAPSEGQDVGEIAIALDHGLALLRKAIDETDVAFGQLVRT